MTGKLVRLSHQDGIQAVYWEWDGTVSCAIKGDCTASSRDANELVARLFRLSELPYPDFTVVLKEQTVRIYKKESLTLIVFVTRGHPFMKSLYRSVHRVLEASR